MDATSSDDNTTIIGGSTAYGKGQQNGADHPKGKHLDTIADTPAPRTQPRMAKFLHDSSNIEGRPFFIPIGKDGIIAAVQKLDTQLRNVSLFSGSQRRICTD
jgi:hypothetical protein